MKLADGHVNPFKVLNIPAFALAHATSAVELVSTWEGGTRVAKAGTPVTDVPGDTPTFPEKISFIAPPNETEDPA